MGPDIDVEIIGIACVAEERIGLRNDLGGKKA